AIAESLARAVGSDAGVPSPAALAPASGSRAKDSKDTKNTKRSKDNKNSQRSTDSSGSTHGTGAVLAERHGLTTWDVGDIPRKLDTTLTAGAGTQRITG